MEGMKKPTVSEEEMKSILTQSDEVDSKVDLQMDRIIAMFASVEGGERAVVRAKVFMERVLDSAMKVAVEHESGKTDNIRVLVGCEAGASVAMLAHSLAVVSGIAGDAVAGGEILARCLEFVGDAIEAYWRRCEDSGL